MNEDIILYDKKHQRNEFKNFEYYNQGKCAKIFKNNNLLLKIYKPSCKYNYYLSRKVFDKLQDLDLPNVVKLYDYYHYYNSKLYQILPMDAYTMGYVKQDNTQIIYQDKEYLLKVIYQLEKTCLELAKNKITIHDAHHSNIIFNRECATLIDVDLYSKNNLASKKSILLRNKMEILKFLKSTINDEIEKNKESILGYKINNLFYIDLNKQSMIDMIDEVFIDDTLIKSLTKDI